MSSRVVIAGGSGFIGRHLTAELLRLGYEVTVLSRSLDAPKGASAAPWDGKSVGFWARDLEGAAAVVNLAGRSINCRPTRKNIRQIRDSRVLSVHALAGALSQLANPPPVFVQASAVGFYGDAGITVCTESTPAGSDEIAEICHLWENALAAVATANGLRKVILRLGIVLGPDGGFFPVMSRLVRLYLGGQAGDGKQFVSWIHVDDVVHMITAAIQYAEISGTYNATAPNPVTNGEIMEAFRAVWKRPWSPPVPALAVKIGGWIMGSNGHLALMSQRAIPEHFQRQDFPFQFAEVRPALQDLVSRARKDITK